MLHLSIITINYNNKLGLEKTILSIIAQSQKAFEFIVIDGGSSDGSVDIINNYEKGITYSVSEKDRGIYDAQNKGIKKAKGDYLLFLNSGDTFYDNSVIEDVYQFIQLNTYGIIYGNTYLLFSNKTNELLCPPPKLDLNYFFKRTLNHQACFIKKELFTKYGLYNTNYKICADFDFFFKVFVNAPENYVYLNRTICNYQDGGLSSDKANYELMVSEKTSILKSYLTKEIHTNYYKKQKQDIPLKYRILEQVYKIPFLNWLFKRVYLILKKNN